MTRPLFFLALLVAAVIGLAMGWFVWRGGLQSVEERFRDTARALKVLHRDRGGTGTPHQQTEFGISVSTRSYFGRMLEAPQASAVPAAPHFERMSLHAVPLMQAAQPAAGSEQLSLHVKLESARLQESSLAQASLQFRLSPQAARVSAATARRVGKPRSSMRTS